MKHKIRYFFCCLMMLMLVAGCSAPMLDEEGAMPEVTEAPVVTEAPTATETPIVTDVPEVTEAPMATETPIVTEAPVVTKAPTPMVTPTPIEPPATEASSGALKLTEFMKIENGKAEASGSSLTVFADRQKIAFALPRAVQAGETVRFSTNIVFSDVDTASVIRFYLIQGTSVNSCSDIGYVYNTDGTATVTLTATTEADGLLLCNYDYNDASLTPQKVTIQSIIAFVEEEVNDLRYTFDFNKKYQVIDGFGAAFTWYADWIFYTSDADEKALLDALFSDAKLSVIRLKNEYEYAMDGKDKNISTMKNVYNAAVERAAEYKEEPIVLLSCWSPPASLKSNSSINGGGTLAKDADGNYRYDEYAKWWVESVKYYRENGLKIDYVSIQNECDFKAGYDGCEFGKSETYTYASYAKAFLAVYRAFQAEFGEDAPKMIAPETMTCKPSDLYAYIKEIIETEPKSIYGVGYHLYIGGSSSEENNTSTANPDSFNTNFSNLETYFGKYDYARWQTEFFRGKGIQTAALISNAMTQGNMNSYLYWGAVWDGAGDSFEANEMIGITKDGNSKFTWKYCADYYAVRHFSEFVRPGYTRIEASIESNDTVKNSAYLSEDGKTLVLVIINTGNEERIMRIPAENCSITDSDMYQSVLSTKDTSKNVLYENIGELGEGNTVSLPGESITTIVLSLE